VKKLMAVIITIITLVASCACPTPPADTSTIEQRLDLLVTQLEEQRQTLHIPGMAIAIVKDDEIILAQGFGVSDVEAETLVTEETIFAIGSTTKAFTSTLVGMLVDEGKMDWDDPVTDYLPYFTLDIDSEDETAQVTIRDVLSHRTGFTRMGLLFGSGEIPREEILLDATAAEPFAPFREQFYYSNVIYMSAGIAAGVAAESDWDTLIDERILEPLGMDSTTTSIIQAQEDPRLALGYIWDEDLQAYKHKPMRNVDNIAPAGSINSNVMDMAQWLRLQLGDGEYEGQRLISEASLHETWTSQIEIAEGTDYGLGWMIQEWEGQPVIQHGGNVDGFTAEVAMLPESDLGFVLLTNASASPLQQTSVNMVWEALLGEWTGDDSGMDIEEYEPYLGTYIANFGQFQDEEFTVLVQNGRLAIDVPGQQVFELKDPDEEGKWYFVISDQIAVSFDSDEAGNVTGMKLYQAGYTFELPREGAEIEPEIPLSELQKYLGYYYSEELDTTAEVLIQNNRLAIYWPGEMTYELYPPDEEGIWVFRISDRFSLRFNENEAGQVESLTYYQVDEEYLLERTEVSEALPTVVDILELRDTENRVAALRDIGAYRATGTIHSLQSGVWGEFTMYVDGDDKYRIDSDYGKYGHSHIALDGDYAWSESSFTPFDKLRGIFLEQLKTGHPYALDGDWRDFYDTIEVLRADSLDGRDVYVLSLEKGDLPPVTIFVDADTGDVLKSITVAIQEGGVGIPITTLYEDYREVSGFRMSFRAISTNEASGTTVMQIETIETNIDIEEGFFVMVGAD